MMLKQFLGRLPKKPSKATSDLRDASSFSSPMGSRSSDATNDESGNAKDANLAGSHLSLNSSYSNGNISTQLACQSLSYNSDVGNYDPLPSLKDASNSERQSLFLRKLNQCCFVFDFNDTSKHLKEKDVKRQALLEVVEFVSSARGKFTEVMMQEILKAVSANLFRPLATQFHENKALEGNNLEEDEPLMDPAWPHMQYVYELLLRFVASPEMDTKLAKRYIDQSFLLKLLDLFDSEDPREREYLKTILHRIYGKFMVHRPFLRKSMNNIFYRFIFETEKFNGIAELLEVLGSIINGFALPLKEEHKSFLVRVLIPLHKPKCLSMYHQQLSYCITQFVEKDSKLADTVLSGLLKYWPITNSTKEVMFLSELEEVLEATQMPEFQRCMVPLFQQIARSVGSTHFQVAERALYLWNNDHIENLIRQNRKVIMPIIIPSFEKNATSHWNQVVKNLTLNVRRILNDVDPELLKECLIKFQAEEARDQLVKTKQQALWQQLEEIAATKSLSTPSTPMSSK